MKENLCVYLFILVQGFVCTHLDSVQDVVLMRKQSTLDTVYYGHVRVSLRSGFFCNILASFRRESENKTVTPTLRFIPIFLLPAATLLAGPRSQKGSVAQVGPRGGGVASRCRVVVAHRPPSNYLSALLQGKGSSQAVTKKLILENFILYAQFYNMAERYFIHGAIMDIPGDIF